jgi:hypothetical protein
MPGAGLFIPGFSGSAGIWMGFIKDCQELAIQVFRIQESALEIQLAEKRKKEYLSRRQTDG